jgi:hypothetical protein
MVILPNGLRRIDSGRGQRPTPIPTADHHAKRNFAQQWETWFFDTEFTVWFSHLADSLI